MVTRGIGISWIQQDMGNIKRQRHAILTFLNSDMRHENVPPPLPTPYWGRYPGWRPSGGVPLPWQPDNLLQVVVASSRVWKRWRCHGNPSGGVDRWSVGFFTPTDTEPVSKSQTRIGLTSFCILPRRRVEQMLSRGAEVRVSIEIEKPGKWKWL